MKRSMIDQAKTNLSRLIEKACDGEEIIIARGSEPVARLVPLATTDTGAQCETKSPRRNAEERNRANPA